MSETDVSTEDHYEIPLKGHLADRWANIIAGAIMILFTIGNGAGDLDDIFFATVEVVALALIICFAWQWHGQEA